jgi:DNA-binding PadR family transcriptional regulator
MHTEITSQAILAHLVSIYNGNSRLPTVALNQMKLWIIPQKSEHDHNYDINYNYFETLLLETIKHLLTKGYITSSVSEGIEDGDAGIFTLTEKGVQYIEALATSHQE